MSPLSKGWGVCLRRENFIKPEFTKRKLFYISDVPCHFNALTDLRFFCYFILFHLSPCHLEMTQTLQGPVPALCFQLWCVAISVFFKQILVEPVNLTSIRRYLLYMRETAVCCTEFPQNICTLKASGHHSCSLPGLHPLHQRFSFTSGTVSDVKKKVYWCWFGGRVLPHL